MKLQVKKYVKPLSNTTFQNQVKIVALGDSKYTRNIKKVFTYNELLQLKIKLIFGLNLGEKFPNLRLLSYPQYQEKVIEFSEQDSKLYVVEH